MATRYKNITIHPAQGGKLVASASDDIPLSSSGNVFTSSANYTQKINFRRETDGELRREGWELFAPTGADDALKSDYPIRGIKQFTGSDGTPILLAIAGDTLYRLSSGDRRFSIIGSQDELNPNPVAEYATVDGLDSPDETQITLDGQLYGLIGDAERDVDWFDNDADDFTWSAIYTFKNHMDAKEADGTYRDPFEGGAYRWEFVEVRNHVIINNGVDLPVVYKSEWDYAVPLYGLRENGVISVGTISNYQDRLFCGDLTVIDLGYDDWFKYAVDPYGSTYPELGKDDDTLWVNGDVKSISINRYQYRVMYSAEGDPKLFNTGIIDSTTNAFIAEGGGLPGKITIENGEYLFTPDYSRWAVGIDGSMLQEYLGGGFASEEHVGLFITAPQAGEKLVDESYASGDIAGAIQTLVRNFPERALPFVTTGGPTVNIDGNSYASYGFAPAEIIDQLISNISTLSGIFFIKGATDSDPYKLVNKDGNSIKLLAPTGFEYDDVDGNGNTIEYTAVLRPYAEQIKKPAAVQEFVQDGSRILKMKPLADKLVVYRDSGFYFITQSNSNINPFAIDPRYQGGRIPDFRHTIIDLGGNQHMFMGNSGVYVINRSSTEPKPIEVFELGPQFWNIVPPEFAEFVYAVDNPVTREIFINCPLGYKIDSMGNRYNELGEQSNIAALNWGVIAYDYINQTLSQIDQSFTACTTVRKPKYNRVGPEELWFLMGVHQSWDAQSTYIGSDYRDDESYGGVLCRYGYGPPARGESEPYRIYHRLGAGYDSIIKSGLIDFGDSFSDKEVRSYVLELSSKYGVTPIKVKISTNVAPQGTEVIETMDGEVDYVILNNIVDENMIPLYLRAPYLRDQIIVESEKDHKGYSEFGYVRPKTNDKQNQYYWQDEIPVVYDNPVKLVGRTFEVSGVDSRSTTQTINQG